jgi:hypothetical protein
MGCLFSQLTAEQAAALRESRELDETLKDTKQTEAQIIKLLLLGTGESGSYLYISSFTH